MSQPVTRFENVGKLYRLGTVGTGTIAHDLRRWWITSVRHKEDPYLKIGETNDRASKGHSDYVYALKDINFEVQEGDVLGIIGKNGAGKSTLLKLLSRVTAPTTGKIYTRGRIASLLEVGTGFHPELTGRENIYMNGSILGMKKQEIDRKLDEIIDFSGCERYIDTPVKRYSSGMMVRLGFAVAAHLDPEILVVDEVLAVGDAEFQKKAIGKMQDVSKGQGRTVLFVSHNMAAVRALCNNGVLMENGKIAYLGTADNCVTRYLTNEDKRIKNHSIIDDKYRPYQRTKEYEFLEICTPNDVNYIATCEAIFFKLKIKRNTKKINKIQIGILINNSNDTRVGACNTDEISIPDVESFIIQVSLSDLQLAKGIYTLDFSINSYDYTYGYINYDAVYNVIGFEVCYLDAEHTVRLGDWPSIHGNCFFQKTKIELL